MADEMIVVDETRLAALAADASEQMKKAVLGKPKDAVAQATAGSLNAVAAMLDALTANMRDRRNDHARLETALRRIANLEIRSGTQLLERGDWKKIAGEFQAIAEEAIQPRRRG